MAMDFLAGEPVKDLKDLGKKSDDEAQEKTKGFEVGYDLFSINGKTLGHGEPVLVKQAPAPRASRSGRNRSPIAGLHAFR